MGINAFFIKTGGFHPDILDSQALHTLYEQGLDAQSRISVLKAKIRVAKTHQQDMSTLINALKSKQRQLLQLKKRFKFHLKQQPDYKTIRANAKRYVYLQNVDKLQSSLVTNILSNMKEYLNRIFQHNIRTSKYFNLYANHLNYLNDASVKNILLQPFALLLDKQKEIFIDQLNKQSYLVQDKILASQSMQDLIDLRSACSQLNYPELRYKVKEHQVKLLEK